MIFFRWHSGVSFLFGLLSFLSTATESSAFQPQVVGVHARNELPWLQATATIRNPQLPIAHLVTLASLLEKEVNYPSSPLPETLKRLMAGGGSFRVKAWPEGWIVQVSGPASLVEKWRVNPPNLLLPDLPFFVGETTPQKAAASWYSASEICEQSRKHFSVSSSSRLWEAFFRDASRAELDEASCQRITFTSLKEAHKQLLKTSWLWLLEGRLGANLPPKQAVLVPPAQETSPRFSGAGRSQKHAFPLDTPPPDSRFHAVAQLFDARNVSPVAQRALVRFLSKKSGSEVHFEHRFGNTLLIFRSAEPRSHKAWQARITSAQTALNESSFRSFLDDEKARDVFLLASVGAWSNRNAKLLLLGFPTETPQTLSVKQLQGLLFPSAIRGEFSPGQSP